MKKAILITTILSAFLVPAAFAGCEQGEPPALPDGWLDSPYLDAADAACVREAELSVSGG